jgi:hypothetical protein
MFTRTHLLIMAATLAGAISMYVFLGNMRGYRLAAMIAVAVALEASGTRRGKGAPYGGVAVQRAVTWTLGVIFVGMLAYALREIVSDGRGLVILKESLRLLLATAGLFFCHRISRRLRYARRTA